MVTLRYLLIGTWPTRRVSAIVAIRLHQNFATVWDFQEGACTVNKPDEKCFRSFENHSRTAPHEAVTSCAIALDGTA
ncbi:MAG: hypothetical protein JWN70_7230 [Planctomycetaceae bacterium]|nr:hypothetical protein [Planctomycetaceae bacterium]